MNNHINNKKGIKTLLAGSVLLLIFLIYLFLEKFLPDFMLLIALPSLIIGAILIYIGAMIRFSEFMKSQKLSKYHQRQF